MSFGVRFQPPAPVSAAHVFAPSLSALRNEGQTPNNAEEERLSPAPLGLLGAKGSRPPEREGSSISWPRGAAVPRRRSRSVRGEGRGEATNLPGNVSSDLYLLGNERRRGKSGDESSSCGSGERCGESGAAGSRPPLAPYSGCSTLVLSFPDLTRNPISPGSCECACLYFSLSQAMTTYTSLFS